MSAPLVTLVSEDGRQRRGPLSSAMLPYGTREVATGARRRAWKEVMCVFQISTSPSFPMYSLAVQKVRPSVGSTTTVL